MTDPEQVPERRIGRPPKVDEHGTPTRERLLNAAIEVCVEDGYEGATLSEIARRADVSTPAVYSHFPGKAELLVAASRRELTEIGTHRIPRGLGLRQIARRFLSPSFADIRVLVVELHRASIRHPEVAELLGDWQLDTAQRFEEETGLTASQVKMFYLLLLGTSHLDAVRGVEVDQAEMETEITRLIEGWLSDRYSQ
jgi:AcrR family transcriptional regulator